MLNRPAGEQLFQAGVVLCLPLRGEVHILMHDAVQLAEAGDMLHEQMPDIGGFAAVVQGRMALVRPVNADWMVMLYGKTAENSR